MSSLITEEAAKGHMTATAIPYVAWEMLAEMAVAMEAMRPVMVTPRRSTRVSPHSPN